jgi:LPXTG-site transpeptidase (sortase) family protein
MIVTGAALMARPELLMQLADGVIARSQSGETARWMRLHDRASAAEPTGSTAVKGTVIKPGKEGYLLVIPKLRLRMVVRELEPDVFLGRNTPTLKRYGLGQVPYTHQLRNVSPGGSGTAAITGHRTTSGAPFRHIDRLRAGDVIIVRKRNLEQSWTVVGSAVVPPSAVGAIKSRPGTKRLVLLACTPPFTARERLLVNARLTREAAISRSAVGAEKPRTE